MTQLRNKQEVLEYFRLRKLENKLYHTCLLVGAKEFIEQEILPALLALLECPNSLPPCGICPSCIKVKENCHPDIRIVGLDNQNISIEQVRDIIYESTLMPWEGLIKIFVIHQVHLLRDEVANALLKTLEEPFEHCIFLLTTDNEKSVLDTIVSRCQIFYTKGDASFDDFKKNNNISSSVAETIWTLATQDITTAEDIIHSQWEMRCTILKGLLEKQDPIFLGNSIAEICSSGEAGKEKTMTFMIHIASLCHDIIIQNTIKTSQGEFFFNKDLIHDIEKIAPLCSIRKIQKFLSFLWKMRSYLSYNINLGLLWENICLQFQTIYYNS